MKTGHLDVRIEQDLIDKLDEWRNRQTVPPSRTSTISHILETWLTERAPSASEQPRPLTPAARR